MSKRDVSPEKKNQENNQKSQIKLWFSTKKENQDHNEKRLLYVYASEKIHTLAYIITSSRCFTKKKSNSNTEPEIIDCAPPEKHPNP